MHNICSILQKLANERPEDKFAFFSDEGEMSYGELWEEANKEYKNIKKMGKNRKVIIKTKTEKELLVRIISHWINGNMITIVPIDISEIRLESICKTLNPTVLETILNGSVSTEIISDQEMKDSPDDAICVFTSGSTGAAKGVVITHSNIIEGCKNVISAKKITKDDKGLCLLPLTHINGFITTFCSIIFSNSKVVYNQAPYDAITIAKLVYDQQCTWMSAVPFHYTEMVKKSDLISPDKLESLRFCRSASAPLPISVFEAFVNHYQIPLVETMGMTEATGQIFSNSIDPGKQVSGAVGFPIGFEAKIADINGNKLPDNSEGELLISGPALMREYYNSPETTNKALINGWLRTGDLATIDKDGLVRITGRIKDIAIFSGENISLSSLENKIIDIFGFTEVAAKSIPDNTFGEKIEFYIENKSKISIKNNELVKKISELLPSASAIKSIYIVDHIPRSNVGKKIKGEISPEISLKKIELDHKSHIELIKNITNDSTISKNSNRKNHPKWDSLAHTSIIIELEKIQKRELSGQEIVEIKTANDVEKYYKKIIAPQIDETKNDTEIDSYIDKLKEHGLSTNKLVYLILSEYRLSDIGVTNLDRLITKIKESIRKDQTIIMNTFSWDFCRTGSYSKSSTPCETGIINELFRRDPETNQSNHPIYSFTAFGYQSEELMRHQSDTCWGKGSVLDKICQHSDCRVISDGVDLLKGNPSIHFLEEKYKVPYREFKKFSGTVSFSNQKIEYTTSMFVRSLDDEYVNDWQPIIKVISERKLYKGNFKKGDLYSYNNNEIIEIAEVFLKKSTTSLARKK